jgi:hypothetical protein
MAADEAVHGCDVGRRRRQPGADRPHRLVGDDQVVGVGTIRQRGLGLLVHDVEGLLAFALVLGFADADDGGEPRAPGSAGLAVHLDIGLEMVLPALGMADDDGDRAGVGEHLGGKIAGEGAGRLGMAILRADRDRRALHQAGERRQQRRRRTHHQVGVRRGFRSAAHDLGQLGRRAAQPVHFPVAGHQGARGICHDGSCRDLAIEGAPEGAVGRVSVSTLPVPIPAPYPYH